jgi:hypothetical protein
LPGAAPSFACLLARHDSNITLTGTIRLITLLARTTSPSALTVSGQLERALAGCQRSHPATCSVSWNAAGTMSGSIDVRFGLFQPSVGRAMSAVQGSGVGGLLRHHPAAFDRDDVADALPKGIQFADHVAVAPYHADQPAGAGTLELFP